MRKSLTLIGPILLTIAAPAPAKPAPPSPTVIQSQKLSLNFTVPRRGTPTSTAGGASRGACMPGTKMLTPLLPKDGLGLTFAERPSFFVYVPPAPSQSAEFLLLTNDDTEIVYQTNFTIPASPGIVRFDLPPDAPPLQIGKQYHWYITLNCDATRGPGGNPGVEGWIERDTPNPGLVKKLATTKPGDRPALYAKAGIWHETLTSLADLRRRSPNNVQLQEDWRSLLQSVELDPFANEPLLER